ncbi:hypothetical protein KKF91_00405 [Myxococcota bacterium]|nr:hypothetical protein [Myxococcota bacterium]MBU1428996.1 hypothetical protein [Myxococcota bacterium]MBU1900156.1 hypothetical protein [Myxococcota bacterium]
MTHKKNTKAIKLVTMIMLTSVAQAQVTINQKLTASIYSDNKNGVEGDDGYKLIEERLEIRGNGQNIEAYARIDLTKFIDAPSSDYRDDERLERLLTSYHLGDWRIDIGDIHLEMGRGIALSLKPIESAGVDTALRGGQMAYQSKKIEFNIFGGEANPANLDTLSQKHVVDTPDRIIGIRGQIQANKALPTIGIFGIYLKPDDQKLNELLNAEKEDQNITTGITIQAREILNTFDIYIEGDYQKRRLIDQEETGKAIYSTIDLTIKETIILIEGIYLNGFEQRGSPHTATDTRVSYNRPPTLERIDQEVLETRDILGGRIRLERPIISEDYVGHINGMYRIQSPDSEEEITQIHGYAGLEIYLPDKLAFSGGYRDERYSGGALKGEKLKSMIHGEGDLTVGLEGYELHAQSTNELRRRPSDGDSGGEKRYARGSTLLGLERGGRMGLTLEYGYDTEKEGVRQHFFAGIAHWKFLEGQKLRLAAGTQRGGVKCIAGICREYPAFAGARFEWLGHF